MLYLQKMEDGVKEMERVEVRLMCRFLIHIDIEVAKSNSSTYGFIKQSPHHPHHGIWNLEFIQLVHLSRSVSRSQRNGNSSDCV